MAHAIERPPFSKIVPIYIYRARLISQNPADFLGDWRIRPPGQHPAQGRGRNPHFHSDFFLCDFVRSSLRPLLLQFRKDANE
jgi:hypothetical protein